MYENFNSQMKNFKGLMMQWIELRMEYWEQHRRARSDYDLIILLSQTGRNPSFKKYLQCSVNIYIYIWLIFKFCMLNEILYIITDTSCCKEDKDLVTIWHLFYLI